LSRNSPTPFDRDGSRFFFNDPLARIGNHSYTGCPDSYQPFYYFVLFQIGFSLLLWPISDADLPILISLPHVSSDPRFPSFFQVGHLPPSETVPLLLHKNRVVLTPALQPRFLSILTSVIFPTTCLRSQTSLRSRN